MVDIQRPGTLDVTHSNPRRTLYLVGDENTDGSVRFFLDGNEMVAHAESRENGVWNDAPFRTSAKSLEIGRDLFLSAGFSFIETGSFSTSTTEERTLIPHIVFTEEGTALLHTPILKGEETFIVDSGAVFQIVSTKITQGFTLPSRRLIKTITHLVGSVSATEEVLHSIYLGTDETGFLISQIRVPASELPANTPWALDFDYALGLEANQSIFTVTESNADISLQVDASFNIVTTMVAQVLGEIDIYTDNRVFNNDIDGVMDLNLNPVYGNQFV